MTCKRHRKIPLSKWQHMASHVRHKFANKYVSWDVIRKSLEAEFGEGYSWPVIVQSLIQHNYLFDTGREVQSTIPSSKGRLVKVYLVM